MQVKYMKVDERMTRIREMLSLLGKDCDVIESAQGTSMIVPRRSKQAASNETRRDSQGPIAQQ